VVDALGNRTELTYDGRGNLVQLRDALDQVTRYTYNGKGQLTSIIDPAGATTRYDRDTAGRIAQIVDALNRVTSFTYNADGLLDTRIDPNGSTTRYQLGALGQITGEAFGDGSSQAFSYDSAGRKTRATSGDVDLEYLYQDPLGRLSAVVNHTLGQTVKYAYDAQTGKRASVTRPDGTQAYAYDGFGQLTSTTGPDGKKIAFTYDRFGQLAEKRFPNGTVQKDGWDAWGRLSSRRVYSSAGVLLTGYSYTYDAIGRRVSSTDAQGRTTTWKYDALHRLIEEKSGGTTKTYAYDAAGNRVSITEDGTVKETYTYDDTHRLLTRTAGSITTTFDYDENGNLVEKLEGTRRSTYTYDGTNRLTGAQGPGGTDVYRYDAEGRRAYRSDSSGEAWILYDDEDAILESDAAGKPLRGFVHGPGIDEPLALIDYQRKDAWYYHTDAIGSVIALSDSKGALANAYRYDPFGVLTTDKASVANDYTFAGRRFDADTGLYDLRARQLDPAIGRFLQVDPRTPASFEQQRTGIAAALSAKVGQSLESLLGIPQMLNPYAYAGNNPQNMIDPAGENAMALPAFLLALMEFAEAITAFLLSPFFFWILVIVAIILLVAIVILMAANGNQADTGIMGEAQALIAAGLAAGICEALAMLMDAAKRACDSARQQRIKKTQKAKGCRHSRHS
jgi:RHS repeat-associated protein